MADDRIHYSPFGRAIAFGMLVVWLPLLETRYLSLWAFLLVLVFYPEMVTDFVRGLLGSVLLAHRTVRYFQRHTRPPPLSDKPRQ